MGVSENRGYLNLGPYDKDPTIYGAILGSPTFGNPHIRGHVSDIQGPDSLPRAGRADALCALVRGLGVVYLGFTLGSETLPF